MALEFIVGSPIFIEGEFAKGHAGTLAELGQGLPQQLLKCYSREQHNS